MKIHTITIVLALSFVGFNAKAESQPKEGVSPLREFTNDVNCVTVLVPDFLFPGERKKKMYVHVETLVFDREGKLIRSHRYDPGFFSLIYDSHDDDSTKSWDEYQECLRIEREEKKEREERNKAKRLRKLQEEKVLKSEEYRKRKMGEVREELKQMQEDLKRKRETRATHDPGS